LKRLATNVVSCPNSTVHFILFLLSSIYRLDNYFNNKLCVIQNNSLLNSSSSLCQMYQFSSPCIGTKFSTQISFFFQKGSRKLGRFGFGLKHLKCFKALKETI
jgi:hypothetical protein